MTASALRAHIARQPTVALIGGFLGAGKTTLLTRIAEHLRQRSLSVVIVTNDQGEELLDTQTVRASGIPAGEVTGGCFCCRFEDLAQVIGELLEEHRPDVVLAEAVGSCTDLAATVVRPLRTRLPSRVRVAPLLVAVDPLRLVELASPDLDRAGLELGWLLHTQLEEADLVVVTKSDVANDQRSQRALTELSADYPSTPTLSVSAVQDDAIEPLVSAWLGDAAVGREADMSLDYERYGDAEQLLAWADRILRLRARAGTFNANAWLSQVLARLDERIMWNGGLVGHVKLAVTDAAGRAKGSLFGAGRWQIDEEHPGESSAADVLINARVRLDGEVLGPLVDTCVREVSLLHGVDAYTRVTSDKVPDRPRPTYRMSAAERR